MATATAENSVDKKVTIPLLTYACFSHRTLVNFAKLLYSSASSYVFGNATKYYHFSHLPGAMKNFHSNERFIYFNQTHCYGD
jgi:hypothetical protein